VINIIIIIIIIIWVPGLFSGGKPAGEKLCPPTPTNTDFKLRVELYIHSPTRCRMSSYLVKFTFKLIIIIIIVIIIIINCKGC